ncbi:MAG TPA: Fur family transcriptional regulator [Candidatus Saccharimonadia bacterium]|nr:Fur family transcriptional regulator [Candidatus Saccharimonadia bacterium]
MFTKNSEQLFKDRLHAAGERVTSPRLVIFRMLVRHAPLSMPQIIQNALADSIDKVTVYRTVELLRRLDLVQEVGLGRNRLFELGDTLHAHHHHLTCTECGKVIDFDNETIEADLQSVGKQLGFDITSHQLEASGVCSACGLKTTAS